jgi:hypothetical protein
VESQISGAVVYHSTVSAVAGYTTLLDCLSSLGFSMEQSIPASKERAPPLFLVEEDVPDLIDIEVSPMVQSDPLQSLLLSSAAVQSPSSSDTLCADPLGTAAEDVFAFYDPAPLQPMRDRADPLATETPALAASQTRSMPPAASPTTYKHINDYVEPSKEIRDQLTCSICLGPYRDPRRLTCDHIFCLACLRELASRSVELRCPECRSLTFLSVPGREGVDALPVDRRIKGLVSTMYPEEPSRPEQSSSKESQEEYVHISRQEVLEDFRQHVPFTLSPQQAQRKFEEWKHSLWTAPTDFRQSSSGLLELTANYVPFYCFSLTTFTTYQASILAYDPHKDKHNRHTTKEYPENYRSPTPAVSSTQLPLPHGSETDQPEGGLNITPTRAEFINPTSVTHDISTTSPGNPSRPSGFNTDERWVHTALDTCFSTSQFNTRLPVTVRGTVSAVTQSTESLTSRVLGMFRRSPPQIPVDPVLLPSQRPCSISGSHQNSFIDVLACATDAINPDLLSGLRSPSLFEDPDMLWNTPSPQDVLSGNVTTTNASYPSCDREVLRQFKTGVNLENYTSYLKRLEHLLFNSPLFVTSQSHSTKPTVSDIEIAAACARDNYEAISLSDFGSDVQTG